MDEIIIDTYAWWQSIHPAQKGMFIFWFFTPVDILVEFRPESNQYLDTFFAFGLMWVWWNGFK